MIEKAFEHLKVQRGVYNVIIAVFVYTMMKYVFISMDHFNIAAFVASSKLNVSHKMHPMLSQELYFQIPVFEKINTHQRTFYFFLLPQYVKKQADSLFGRSARSH